MRMIDLSVDLFEGMTMFTGGYHAPFSSEITGTYEDNGCLVHRLVLATHTGTHIDAPAHFFQGAATIDQVPLDMLVGDCLVCRLQDIRENSHVIAGHISHLEVNQNVGVLINTGWHRRWDSGGFYKDFPVFEPEAAQVLVDKGAKFIACDLPLGAEVHKIVLGAGRLLVENLVNLDSIESDRIKLLALPLKVRGVDGAPARVVAIVE
ncbi:MAG: cyclase family protein [Candidatus Eisenbacteria sp.]|nr:cyclase family protein [Candidatus Eisenbacteria bacterium]